MFLFQYQNFRHTLPSWDPRKKNLESTYGQFDMPMLRKSLKDRFTLFGCGTHPLHKLTNVLSMSSQTLGHFVAIEDPKIAVWLKLNYDHISKTAHNHGRELTYMGGYKDINVAEIQEIHERVNENRRKASTLQAESFRLKGIYESMYRFITADPTLNPHLTQQARKTFTVAMEELAASRKAIELLAKRYEDELFALKAETTKYLADRKL